MDSTPRRILGARKPCLIAWKVCGLSLSLTAAALCAEPVHAAAAYNCLIEPAQSVELGTPVGGVLERVEVRRGDRVRRGQLVASLDSRAERAAAELALYKSQLAAPAQLAQSKIDASRLKYDRRKGMVSEGLMASQEADNARAELEQAQAELKSAEEERKLARLEHAHQTSQMSLRTIHSPFDGVVVDQMMWPGEVVEPGSSKHAIVKIAKLDPLRVRVVLPMRAFGEPTLGMTATVVPEILPGTVYRAKVASVDRIIDAASGTFVVFLDLPNPKLDTPSGVKCKAAFAPSKAPSPL
ncbi:efflux RND transporter periplasmic adaptor subunit [Lysobacter sp. CA199]|uniref:efflux RND transporter periplasmic adaptor subunit n=1 Tax=Lysobacter sp. CA199 TaxID=3455608 RepID=UPI003F8D37EC